MTRDVHEVEVWTTDQLDFGRVEEAVVVLADETGVLDGFLREFADVRFGADDADVVGLDGLALIRQGDVLADQHPDADAGHIKAVEEGLYGLIDLHALSLALVFQYALGDGRDDTVVPPFDVLEGFGEAFVVVIQFVRPVAVVVGGGIIASR